MKDIIVNSAYFGVLLSLLAYRIGMFVKKKLKRSVFNPLAIAIILTIAALLLLDVDYESYYSGAKYLSWLLTPATVCLAIPLYEQIRRLKDNYRAILAGILSGALASMSCVVLMALLFRLDHAQYVTLLPKSVTTAIGMPLAEELGGYPSIAAAVIIITGIIGNICAEGFLKLIRVYDPVAKGVAIGTASHAIGTSRAMEMGDVEGAMSSLSITAAGLITAALASVFAQFI